MTEPNEPAASAAPEPGALRRASAATAAGARTAAPDVASGAATVWSFMQRSVLPALRETFNRLGDWLATVSWKKFALVAILLLILAKLLSEILYGGEPAVVIVDKPRAPAVKEKAKVEVQVGPGGIRIERPTAPSAPSAPPAPAAPAAPSAPPAPAVPAAPGVESTVTVDETGVRIRTQKDGAPIQLVIGPQGVRVEEGAVVPPAPPSPPMVVVERGGAVVIPPDVAVDPGKVEKALQAARRDIEGMVADQIEGSIAREASHYRERSGEWMMTFAFLLILTGITVKVVLGGKRRAERRAQVATATAAEEGLKRQLAEAQLKMMQAQVEPHFLFNTLASVDYLIETDPATASKMQKNLIQYLRAALPQMREGSTTLGKEVQLCRAYLEILKFRMEDRLQYAVTVPQGLMSAQFPPMMLQSLVENSIKHGLEPKPEGGAVTISADIVDGRLRVTVADTGLGFAAAARPGTGVGLANVRERLSALYGGRARLSIEANAPSGTIVIIDVPYTFETDISAAPVAQPA